MPKLAVWTPGRANCPLCVLHCADAGAKGAAAHCAASCLALASTTAFGDDSMQHATCSSYGVCLVQYVALHPSVVMQGGR
jgi:hypothetical protein